ncbi:DUF1801 domain-containing protein [Rheinheimera sp.]|uniref:DUF1801 domain-containing protein n=1 Tax=Rheinheimera sp. TaxID=1869214 RepID=UPI00307D8F53
MHADTLNYHNQLSATEKAVCELLASQIELLLPEAENKVWHAHPVWFFDGNPIVGYSKQKAGIRLMFWSGASFSGPVLPVVGKKFKDASVFYTDAAQVDLTSLQHWLAQATEIQWDYKNLVRRKGILERLS